MPQSDFVVAVLQPTWQIIVCLSHLFVFLAYLNWKLSVIKYIRAYLQPFQISGAYRQIFVVPVLECDTIVTTAAIQQNSTRIILFDQGFPHIIVIITISYIICAMSSLTIHPPATPLLASSPTKNYFPRAPQHPNSHSHLLS